jgi:hypothetical protein
MHYTHTTKKAVGASNTNGLHTYTKSADFPTTDDQGLELKALMTGFAHACHTLHQTEARDGKATYWAARWGMARFLPTIDAARRVLDQIGGRL